MKWTYKCAPLLGLSSNEFSRQGLCSRIDIVSQNDAKLFLRGPLGSILEPSTDLLTPSAKLSTSAEGISLCESSQVEYMRKAADSLGEFEQLVLTSVLLLGEHEYGVAMHEKISELAAPRNVRPGTLRAPVGQRSGNRPGGCSRGSRAMANRNASSVR